MSSDSSFGIHDLSFATTEYVLSHAALAECNGTEIGKYHIGIGQRSAQTDDLARRKRKVRHGFLVLEFVRTLIEPLDDLPFLIDAA